MGQIKKQQDENKKILRQKDLTCHLGLSISSLCPSYGNLFLQSRKSYLNGIKTKLEPTNLSPGVEVLTTSLVLVANKVMNLPMAGGRGRPHRTRRVHVCGLGDTRRPTDLQCRRMRSGPKNSKRSAWNNDLNSKAQTSLPKHRKQGWRCGGGLLPSRGFSARRFPWSITPVKDATRSRLERR